MIGSGFGKFFAGNLHVEILRMGRAGKFRGEAYVDGKLAAEGVMTFALVEKAAT